jgi:hypothetical protein
MSEWKYIRRVEDTGGHLIDPSGKDIGSGYSGHGAGLNNPDLEQDKDIGPIPAGRYLIGTFFDHPKLGPDVALLMPALGTNTFGRSGVFIHGDNFQCNRSASHGCIILSHELRLAIRNSGSNLVLIVT